jgi:hypothetical protein
VLFLDRCLWKLRFLIADGNGSKDARKHQAGHPAWRRLVEAILHRCVIKVPPSLLMKMHDGLLRSLALVPSRQVVCLASSSLRWERLRRLTRTIGEFEQTVNMPFEGLRLPVTANYHQALTRLYGDYMVPPPPNKRTLAVQTFSLPDDGGLSVDRNGRMGVAPQSEER